jgi:hypothetical protein
MQKIQNRVTMGVGKWELNKDARGANSSRCPRLRRHLRLGRAKLCSSVPALEITLFTRRTFPQQPKLT